MAWLTDNWYWALCIIAALVGIALGGRWFAMALIGIAFVLVAETVGGFVSALMVDWRTYQIHVWDLVLTGEKAVMVGIGRLILGGLLLVYGLRELYIQSRKASNAA